VLVVAVVCAALATTATVFAATRHHETTCRGSVTYSNRFEHCNTANGVPVAPTQVRESTIAPTDVNGSANGETYGTAPVDPVGEGFSADQAFAKSPDYISDSSHGAVVGYMKKADMFLISHDPCHNVYAHDLTTIVGYLCNRRPFIPVGVDPHSVTTYPPPPGGWPKP
jgi:hypothetical protein